MKITDQEKTAFLKRLGERIRELREEQRMSLDALAEKAGYTSENRRSSIQKIESGKSDLPAHKLALIANALGTTAGSLIAEADLASITIEDAFIEKYGQDVYDAAMKFAALDHDDRIKILERAGVLLEENKYKDTASKAI